MFWLFSYFQAVVLIILMGHEPLCGMHLEPTPRNLSCYHCGTLQDGDSCRDLQLNNTQLQTSCKQSQMYCSALVFRYTVDSPDLKFWSIDRGCEEKCVEGCIIIGERVKLYLCRTCCTGYLCNHGNGAQQVYTNTIYLILLSLFFFTFVINRGQIFHVMYLFIDL